MFWLVLANGKGRQKARSETEAVRLAGLCFLSNENGINLTWDPFKLCHPDLLNVSLIFP